MASIFCTIHPKMTFRNSKKPIVISFSMYDISSQILTAKLGVVSSSLRSVTYLLIQKHFGPQGKALRALRVQLLDAATFEDIARISGDIHEGPIIILVVGAKLQVRPQQCERFTADLFPITGV